MSDVLDTLHRLRKHQQHHAALRLAEAQGRRDACEEVLAHTQGRLERAVDGSADTQGEAIARRHAVALRMEMQRRRHAHVLGRHDQEVLRCHASVTQAGVQKAQLERVVSLRRTAQRQQRQRAEQTELDAMGLQAWWRRSA